ncbi:MAG: helix-turn-helix transcriptional regulator, partial [Elusimicrobia bacterium]|nr:helix-turn-helix transcriptional regulator [Elusimicrobiota bacterium]
MSTKPRIKSLLERKLEISEYRKRHEESYEEFKLEVQILHALERKGWSYADLAQATHSHKSNISRDLKAGGIFSASFSRISKIAEVLGMKLIALLAPKEQARFFLPQIEV